MNTVNPELRDQLVEIFKAAWEYADEHGAGEGHRTEAGIDAVLASASIAVVEDPSEPEQRLSALMTEISNLVDFEYSDVPNGYEQSADAMWKAGLAAFNFAASEVGATGFQASWAALKLYGEAMRIKGPFLMIKIEDALYPQYDLPGRLQEALDGQREWLRAEAKKLLDGDQTFVHPDVLAHWQKLAGAGV